MAMTNLTEDENLKFNDVALLCSADLTGKIHNQLIWLSVINIFLSITAFLGNTLILAAIHKASLLHPPSKLLLRSLATTDLCVGIVAQPSLIAYWLSAVNEQWNICRFAIAASSITGYTLCIASVLTLAAISVDRLLALLLGFRYRQVVTFKRTFVTVLAVWIVSVVGSAMFLFNILRSLLYFFIIILLSLVTSIYCYTMIFLRLRQHQTQVQDSVQGQPSQAIPLNMARYRKTVSSTRWLQFALVACYLPFVVVSAVLTELENRGEKLTPNFLLVWASANTFVLLNSSLNLILYCWKIREVRQAVKETLRGLFC